MARPTRDEALTRRVTALMERHCDGDARAFTELYQLVAPRLLGYLNGMTRDRSAAEDVLQQSMLKAHRARASYVRGADPVPWLYAIAHRTCLDELRARARARVRVALGAEAPEIGVDIDGVAPEARPGIDEATLDRSLRALGTLPAIHRDALVMTKLEGRSMAEAAAALGTTRAALRVRAHRGYVALRALLATPEGEPDPVAS